MKLVTEEEELYPIHIQRSVMQQMKLEQFNALGTMLAVEFPEQAAILYKELKYWSDNGRIGKR